MLVDEGRVICDSKVICAYLEERFPEPELVPRDAVLRARCRYLELKSDTEVDVCLFVLAILNTPGPTHSRSCPDALARCAELLAAQYAFWERALAGRDWFMGAFSLVDVALTPHLRAAAFLGYPPGRKLPATIGAGSSAARRGPRSSARCASSPRVMRPRSSPTACSTRSACTGAATGSSSRCAWGSARGSPTSSRTTARSCRRFRESLVVREGEFS